MFGLGGGGGGGGGGGVRMDVNGEVNRSFCENSKKKNVGGGGSGQGGVGSGGGGVRVDGNGELKFL